MRIKISINLPWPLATLMFALVGALVTGIALLNYYSYQRINQFEAMSKTTLLETDKKVQEQGAKTASAIQTQAEAIKQVELALSNTKANAGQSGTNAFSGEASITSSDLSPYLTGSAQIVCVNDKGAASTGSGTLWKFKEVPYAVITNLHVVKDQKSCALYIPGKGNQSIGFFALEGTVYTFNNNTDTAIVTIGSPLSENNIPKESYNFSLSSLRKCPSSIPIGTPVVLIGFPTFAKRDAKLTIPKFGTLDETYRSVTNGIISGYDTSKVSPRGPLANQNFFISAKIDAGNSGGIALAKDSGGLCVLGVPTWLSVGTYENQGLVQNITNIIP